jgi:hypothetical protein
MKGYHINLRTFCFPIFLTTLFLFFALATIGQTADKLKRPNNLITTDLAGTFSTEDREFSLSYERKITEKASFVGTIGFLGSQDPGTIEEGREEQEFTQKVASGWYDDYWWLLFIPMHDSGSYTNRTTYLTGHPLALPQKTTFLTTAVYVKGGYKVHKVNPYKVNQRAYWFLMPEVLLAVQGYNDYQVSLTEEVLSSHSGHTSYSGGSDFWTSLSEGEEDWTISEILQTRETRKEKRTQMVIAPLISLGYQLFLADRILVGLQGTAGLLIPTNKEKIYLGRGSEESLYSRFSFFAGFAF